MSEKSLLLSNNIVPVVQEIRTVLDSARRNVANQVNNELLMTYWKIGEIIVRYEQDNNIRAAYGEQTLKQMSKELTKELGKGFSRSNLQNMRAFYLTYQKCQTVSGKLSWSHYCELLSISDSDRRSFYEKEAINRFPYIHFQIPLSAMRRVVFSASVQQRGFRKHQLSEASALNGNNYYSSSNAPV